MAGKGASKPVPGSGFIIQLNLGGLVVFSLCLVIAAGLITYGLTTSRGNGLAANSARAATGASAPSNANDTPPAEIPPWGELRCMDVELEQPEEYIAFELGTNRAPTWSFESMTTEKVRALMQSSGLTAEQINRAFSPALMSVAASNTVLIKPDNDLVLSLAPETRSKFYGELAHFTSNHYMEYLFCFPAGTFEARFSKGDVDDGAVALVKKLVYPRGDDLCFSDYELLLRNIPTDAERLHMVKALSRQSAVIPHLRIRPDTDIDKLLGYWNRGMQVKDVRPLLESLKRLPNGGSISLLYLLPPFARERLYTFPVPAQPGDPAIDCHWSTMNFFSETPDNRFANASYTTTYLLAHYYQVAKPCLYGDLVLILNERGDAIHSGVYLADDIIFTKNGNNYAQPWKLMRIKDLVGLYAVSGNTRMVVYRDKSW